METPHLERSLQQDIEGICHAVAGMAHMTERALRGSAVSVFETSRQAAYGVIIRDREIDEREKEIDRLCLQFLVKQQPAAGHLRFVYAAIKINLEIERVGDSAQSIAQQSLKLQGLPSDVPRERMQELAERSTHMFRNAIKAFLQRDLKLAANMIEEEENVDALKSSLNAELVRLFQAGKFPFEILNALMMITRHFERVSDEAQSICLDVNYMCTGEDPKHPGAEAFRILFVDEHNSCRSQMAEAVAKSLGERSFIFASAGLDPKPIDAATLAFMKEKGFSLSASVPKAIYEVPELPRYQVIVALSRQAKRTFPQHPHKAVFVDWSVKDPSTIKGTPEQVRAAYEQTFDYIKTHVGDLMQAARDSNGDG